MGMDVEFICQIGRHFIEIAFLFTRVILSLSPFPRRLHRGCHVGIARPHRREWIPRRDAPDLGDKIQDGCGYPADPGSSCSRKSAGNDRCVWVVTP